MKNQKVTASEGKIFRSKQTDVLLTNIIYLSENDSIDNYEEVDEELANGTE